VRRRALAGRADLRAGHQAPRERARLHGDGVGIAQGSRVAAKRTSQTVSAQMNDEERKRQLALELTRARAAMSRSAAVVSHAADFPNRVKESVKSSPAVWVVGAVIVVGALSAIIPWRRRREPPPNVWSDLGARFGRPRPAAAKVAGGGAAIGAMLAAAR